MDRTWTYFARKSLSYAGDSAQAENRPCRDYVASGERFEERFTEQTQPAAFLSEDDKNMLRQVILAGLSTISTDKGSRVSEEAEYIFDILAGVG